VRPSSLACMGYARAAADAARLFGLMAASGWHCTVVHAGLPCVLPLRCVSWLCAHARADAQHVNTSEASDGLSDQLDAEEFREVLARLSLVRNQSCHAHVAACVCAHGGGCRASQPQAASVVKTAGVWSVEEIVCVERGGNVCVCVCIWCGFWHAVLRTRCVSLCGHRGGFAIQPRLLCRLRLGGCPAWSQCCCRLELSFSFRGFPAFLFHPCVVIVVCLFLVPLPYTTLPAQLLHVCVVHAPAWFDKSKLQVQARAGRSSGEGKAGEAVADPSHDTPAAAAATAAAAAATAAAAAELHRVKEELAAVRSEMDKLTVALGTVGADRDRVAKQLADKELMVGRLKAEVTRLATELHHRETAIKELRHSLHEQEVENAQLRAGRQ
jgi:hypothetical protein